MKVIVVGGSGTIGSAVVKELKQAKYDVVTAGRKSGDLLFDMTSEESIHQLFKQAGAFDAVVITAGSVYFGNFSTMTAAKHEIGLTSKLMGQVNIVHIGSSYINDKGSFTLTSGVLNEDPIRSGASASMINGAINGFVKGAAIELPRGIRINAVSPGLVTESIPDYGAYFPGFVTVPTATVALAYYKSVAGAQTGQIYKVGH